ncbi:MAG: SDR family NAD(P)-dependent oxidoreductase [Gemmatimonadota bacterium]|nr:SDR family NAD(P)-dependent oxidoreductase [Gemmatimonadota bacterium]MDH3421610.1 SDR family NAD(P)-dependent oxidoreductase [Gemmatimonadota bacterium]
MDTGIRPVALVTGSTDGLGREVALRLGLSGAHVIVHGRNEERGRAVVAEIEAHEGSASLIIADLASMEQVRRLAATVLRDYDRLDILVNNAGIGRGADTSIRSESEEGYELRFAVNHLSHFYLTRTLLPLLRRSAPARIVSVSSTAQQAIDFDNVMLEREYDGARAYAQSKLAMIMMTVDLAEELEGTGVTANAVHPAVYMATSMVLNRGGTPMTTIDEGADPVMQVITSPIAGSGNYYRQAENVRANAQAYDAGARRRLHALSMELTGLN